PSAAGVARGPGYSSPRIASPSRVRQTGDPSAASSDVSVVVSFRSPRRKIRPPSTATAPSDSPRPVAFQARGGPPSGHAASSPVSLETLSRLGPRHWAQSPAPGVRDGAATGAGGRWSRSPPASGVLPNPGPFQETWSSSPPLIWKYATV